MELLQLAGKEQRRRASTQPLCAQHLSAPVPQLHSACHPSIHHSHHPSPTVPAVPPGTPPAINLHTFLPRCPQCLERQTNSGGVQQPLSGRTAGCSVCTLCSWAFHHPPRAQNRTKLLFSQPSVCSPALPCTQLAPRPPTEQCPPCAHHNTHNCTKCTKTTPALATPAAHRRDLSSGERERLNPLRSWCPQRPLPISMDHWCCACTQGSELTGSTPALPWYGAWQTACHPVKPGCTHAACTGTARGRTSDVRCTKPTQHQFALEQFQ